MKVIKNLLTALLTVCIVATCVTANVFAEDAGPVTKETFNYVVLGDSVASGFGTYDRDGKQYTTGGGFMSVDGMYLNQSYKNKGIYWSYPSLFVKELQEKVFDNQNIEVDLSNLGAASFMTEDFYKIIVENDLGHTSRLWKSMQYGTTYYADLFALGKEKNCGSIKEAIKEYVGYLENQLDEYFKEGSLRPDSVLTSQLGKFNATLKDGTKVLLDGLNIVSTGWYGSPITINGISGMKFASVAEAIKYVKDNKETVVENWKNYLVNYITNGDGFWSTGIEQYYYHDIIIDEIKKADALTVHIGANDLLEQLMFDMASEGLDQENQRQGTLPKDITGDTSTGGEFGNTLNAVYYGVNNPLFVILWSVLYNAMSGTAFNDCVEYGKNLATYYGSEKWATVYQVDNGWGMYGWYNYYSLGQLTDEEVAKYEAMVKEGKAVKYVDTIDVEDVVELVKYIKTENISEKIVGFEKTAMKMYWEIIEKIKELNPDAQLNLMGTFAPFGKSFECDGVEYDIVTCIDLVLTDIVEQLCKDAGVELPESYEAALPKPENGKYFTKDEIVVMTSKFNDSITKLGNLVNSGAAGNSVVAALPAIIADIQFPIMYIVLGQPATEAIDAMNKDTKVVADYYDVPFVSIYDMPNENNFNPHPIDENHQYIADQLAKTLIQTIEIDTGDTGIEVLDAKGNVVDKVYAYHNNPVTLKLNGRDDSVKTFVTINGVPKLVESDEITVQSGREKVVVILSEKDYPKDAKGTYFGLNGDMLEKLSHIDNNYKSGDDYVVDGLIDYLGVGNTHGIDPSYFTGKVTADSVENQGDRGQSYIWAQQSYRDWTYAATVYSILNSGKGNYDRINEGKSTLIDKLTELIDKFGGSFFTKHEDGSNDSGVLVKINNKTGETRLLMAENTDDEGVIKANAQFRNSVTFNGKFYFCGSVGTYNEDLEQFGYPAEYGYKLALPVIYEVTPGGDGQDHIEKVFGDMSMVEFMTALNQNIATGIRGMAVYKDMLVISYVSVDGASLWASKDGRNFTKVADQNDLFDYPAYNYKDSINGGSVFEMTEFDGKLYISIVSGKYDESLNGEVQDSFRSFAIVTAEADSPEDDWTFKVVVGDKKDGAIYPFGIDPCRTRSGAATLNVFNDHLYIGEYNDEMNALNYLAYNMNASYYADNLKESVGIYRLDKDNNVELVVGDPTPMFPCGGISGYWSGFNSRLNQYIWRMIEFDGKLYVATLAPHLESFLDITGGQVFENKQEELNYYKDLAEVVLNLVSTEIGDELIEKGLIVDPDEVTEDVIRLIYNVATDDRTEEYINTTTEMIKELIKSFDKNNVLTEQQVSTLSDGIIDGYLPIHIDPKLILEVTEFKDYIEDITKDIDGGKYVDAAKKWLEVYEIVTGVKKDKDYAEFMKNLFCTAKDVLDIRNINGMLYMLKVMEECDPGFELYVTEDGVHFEPITKDGFDNKFNYGLRTFSMSEDGLVMGTANPFYGTSAWILRKDVTPEVHINEHSKENVTIAVSPDKEHYNTYNDWDFTNGYHTDIDVYVESTDKAAEVRTILGEKYPNAKIVTVNVDHTVTRFNGTTPMNANYLKQTVFGEGLETKLSFKLDDYGKTYGLYKLVDGKLVEVKDAKCEVAGNSVEFTFTADSFGDYVLVYKKYEKPSEPVKPNKHVVNTATVA